MSSPRILFAYQFLTMGGVETVMKTRLRELARRNIEARVLFLESYGGESLFEEMDDRVSVCADQGRAERYLADFNPDWISAIDTPSIVPVARKIVPGAGIAYEVHTPYPASYAVLLDPSLLEGISGVIVPSQSQKEFIALRMSRPLPIKVVANSVPEEFIQQTPLPYLPKRPIIMWVGRLDPVKNWRGFVELATQIREHADAEFWLVGGLRSSHTEQESLFGEVKRAGLIDSLKWLPVVRYEYMPHLYSLAGRSGGCMVSTSWAESFGMAALEAMASRCPVIAPDVVGLRDIVKHGRTGWLYPPVSVNRACDFILESFKDPNARQIVIENAERMAKGFTPAAAIDQLLGVFSEWSTCISPKAKMTSSGRERLTDEVRTLAEQFRIKSESQVERVLEKELLVESLSQQLAEQRQVNAENHRVIAEGQQLLAEQQQVIAQKEQAGVDNERVISEQQHIIESLRAQLSHKQAELFKITNTLGWRLLSRYGRIKYKYLLPLYRLFSKARRRDKKQAQPSSAPDAIEGPGAGDG